MGEVISSKIMNMPKLGQDPPSRVLLWRWGGNPTTRGTFWLTKDNAKKMIVAVPVSPPDTLKMVEAEVDELVCLFSTYSFYAVGQFYDNFKQTEDSEVMELLK